jgi:sulfoxide reductase catalytic subunit YedY
MPIRRHAGLTEHHVTPRALFNRRRGLLAAAAALGAGWASRAAIATPATMGESPSPLADISGYNNYFEFSTDKKAVRTLAQALTIAPWVVTVEGEVEKPFSLDIAEMRKLFDVEERIYRLRCVEGWSMVVPWNGFPLAGLIKRARPTSRARYVEFLSLKRSSEMIGQRLPGGLEWPYREGLRIDEAMHPLAFAVTGLYGEALPKQNGAPLRIAIPWKYGFKSAKAITHIRLVAEQPATSWARRAEAEYGFYGNVNPDVPHPRWSQARETRIGELRKRPTLYLNGYAEQVASLYAGMNPATLY